MQKKIKLTVHYDRSWPATYIAEGHRAEVMPLDHTSPRVTNGYVFGCSTSKVLNYDPKTGIFETMNSIYVPAEK